MLSAMPETTWLPWCVMQANPCTSPTSTAAAMPAASPSHAEPVTAAVAAAANAEASILPSSPMSTTPDRSEKSPPSAASTSGAAPRIVAATRSARRTSVSLIGSSAVAARSRPRLGSGAAAEPGLDGAPQRVFERAADENDEPLDHHDHVPRQLGHVEGQFGAALVQGAEQHGGQYDPCRVVAPHQRDRDADVARAADEVEEQPVLDARDLVQAHQP